MTNCKWAGSDKPRILPGRHEDGCDQTECAGCVECPDDHCRVCAIAAVDRFHDTCPGCREEARNALNEIRRMCAALPAEVEHRGVDGEAFNLLGPVADAEAWGHRQASAAVGRIDQAWLEDGTDERHPLVVLGTWQMQWQDALEHEDTTLVTVETAAAYLDRQLTYMAGYEHLPFEDFAGDLRRCVAHLEQVLHDGEQIERGAPCPECRRALTRDYGSRAVDDRWLCLNKRCDVQSYTSSQYRGWVEDDARVNAKALSAADLALRFTDEDGVPRVSAGEIRVWGSRDLVAKRGKAHNGMTLYDVAQVEARLDERETRQSA